MKWFLFSCLDSENKTVLKVRHCAFNLISFAEKLSVDRNIQRDVRNYAFDVLGMWNRSWNFFKILISSFKLFSHNFFPHFP